MGAFNIEASSVFKSFVVAHKERMKNKTKPIFPPIKRRKLVVRSRSNSRFKRKESEDRKKTPIRNSGMMGVNHINNYIDFREKDYIKEKDYNKVYYKEKDSYYNKEYIKDYQKDYHHDYSKDYNKEYSREYGNIKDYNLKEKDYYKEKEKNRRKRSRSRSRSVSSGKTSIKNSSERYKKRSNKKEKENIDSMAAYIMGVSENFNIALFSSQLKQRNQNIPSKFEFIMKQEEGFNCNYFKLYFDDEKSCQKLIENSVECGSNILLVLPCFENVNFLIKKTIEDMLPQYQVIIKGKDKDLANIDFSTEISSVYRFFCNYGKIVDFNLEFLPNMIYITYKQKSSVKKLIDCNGSIEYINNNGVTCRFNASKNDFAIYVRNIKDPNKTYENFIPRRQQMKVNTYNPLVGNMQQNKHNGMFSLLNTNLIGSLGNDILPNHSLMGQMNQSLNTQMNSQMTNSHESGGGHSNLPLSSSLQNSGLGSSSGLNNSFNYFQK